MKLKVFQNTQNPPLIIMGMHRSGTSLLAQILQQCGIFMGAHQNSHHEALLFMSINEEIMNLAHAHWDDPTPISYLLENDKALQFLTDYIREKIDKWRSVKKYWGVLKLLALNRNESSRSINWGWKDPRNSLILPLWLNLFPRARVIHVVRNGIDVASSLYEREKKRQKWFDHLLSFRCMTLEGSFSLWAEYEQFCQQNRAYVDPNNYLRIKYEDFLSEPQRIIEQISNLLCTSFDQNQYNEFVNRIDCNRVFAYKRDERLLAFYERNKNHPLMKYHGYD